MALLFLYFLGVHLDLLIGFTTRYSSRYLKKTPNEPLHCVLDSGTNDMTYIREGSTCI